MSNNIVSVNSSSSSNSSNSNNPNSDPVFGTLYSRIVALNMTKDLFAIKKYKKQHTAEDEKTLTNDLLDLIQMLRGTALRLGISVSGEISQETDEIKSFRQVNGAVKDLKEQTLYLLNHTPEEIAIESERKRRSSTLQQPRQNRKEAVLEKLRKDLIEKRTKDQSKE